MKYKLSEESVKMLLNMQGAGFQKQSRHQGVNWGRG